jgi:hypothetical protein
VRAHLYLVGSRPANSPRPGWSPPPYDLASQPQRPGELCAELSFSDHDLADRVSERAAAAGVPPVLYATVGVEATRTLTMAAGLSALPCETVERRLGEAAAQTLGEVATDPRMLAPTRLGDYARALLDRTSRPAPRSASRRVLLRPTETMLAAWTLAAGEDPLTAWAAGLLDRAAPDVLDWETAGACAGQTLAEWVLAQLARRSRSASTAAQTAV